MANTALQELCDEGGVHRGDLIAHFDVQEVTVRRWFEGGGMTVARLQELADYLTERTGRPVTTDEILGRNQTGATA